ncbi:DISARM system phospholipase D-like protein DrmC [Deinococcus alpinitundrae]|uniref:DISARM system phospholipase D-like protein DrmC n=1 Tax=Deinococcus alpinitundrae TaxID=468913 RepID=UPI0013799A3E|nr:DISARM system phospholipase D-like protein DrmC [Deinococcus alpinitundrae]
MDRALLWRAVADVVRGLPALHVERLARSVEDAPAPKALATGGHGVLTDLDRAWRACPVSGDVLAGALRGAAATVADLRARESAELVWTGPTTSAVPVRQTDTVLVQLLGEAAREILVVSFVAHAVPSVVDALNAAVLRGVEITVVLERSAATGGRVNGDSVERIRRAVPSARPHVWADEPDGSGFRGAVHAKCVVVDGVSCLITSANLTSAALGRNMELGVLLRGGRLPKRLADHFRALIERRVLEPG